MSRILGDTVSNASLSSCNLGLLTMAHQTLLIVPVYTLGGNNQQQALSHSPTPRSVLNISKDGHIVSSSTAMLLL
jgi:hypothetical protein